MKKSILTTIILSFFLAEFSFSQDRETFGEYEDSLAILGNIMRNGENDRLKYEANEKYISLLEEALYIKFTGFEDNEQMKQFAEYIKSYLPLILYNSDVQH